MADTEAGPPASVISNRGVISTVAPDSYDPASQTIHANVLQATDSGKCCRWSEVKKVVWNKANLSNFLTFSIMVIGSCLIALYNTDNQTVVKALKLIRAFGLFGFAGGVTNWLAIRMLFEKIPFLIGSGVLLSNFAEIRDNVKRTTMETYFDAGPLSSYVTQKTEIILNSIQFEDTIRDIMTCPEVQAMISDKVDEMFTTPQGLIFGIVLNKDKVKEGVLISVENAGSEMVPVIGELVKNSEFLDEDRLRDQIDRLITAKLMEMQPINIIAVVKDMVETELGWVVVWGNIFGGLLGLALEIVVVLKE